MVLVLGATEIELRLNYLDDIWMGTLKHSELDRPFDDEVIEIFDTEISGEHLVIYSEPQRMIHLTDFFFNRFDTSLFLIERAGYGTFGERQTAIVDGIYDLERTIEFMESFYNNFISTFSHFEKKERYFYNINELYSSSFRGLHHGGNGFSFRLLFNEESEPNARGWQGDSNAEMVFFERVQSISF